MEEGGWVVGSWDELNTQTFNLFIVVTSYLNKDVYHIVYFLTPVDRLICNNKMCVIR